MPSTRSDSSARIDPFLPVLVANLLPLVGVVRFGWDPATLVAIYAIEVGLSIPLAGVKALFAARPPPSDREEGFISVTSAELVEKRGSVRLVAWLPPVYPRNVPFAAAVAGSAGWFLVFAGAVFSEVFDLPALLARPEVLAAALALFAGQLIEVSREYIGDRGYETVSPYAVVETPVRQAFFLVFVGLALPFLDTVGGGVAILVVLVGLKLFLEWSTVRSSRDGFTGWLAGPSGSEDAPATRDPVDRPRGDEEPRADRVPGADGSDGEAPPAPDARFRTHRRAVVATALARTLSWPAAFYITGFAVIWVAVLGTFTDGELPPAIAVGTLAVVVGLCLAAIGVHVAGFVLRYASLEYRRYDDRIVAYDTWLDEPQWAAPVDVLRDVEVVENRLPDRLLDARTFRMTTGWGDEERARVVGPVTDPEGVVEAFDLPVGTTDLRPIDRRIAAASVVLAATIALGVGASLVLDGDALGSPLFVVFLLPFLVAVPRLVWSGSYPDPD
ncbi:DUF6498-containing protein [Halorubrum tibetense]|uniref:DUF6498-containing protein n=1 Tax=Halorubrum tibetense TaxID=175631 RepID=A0ABD5SC37_9EURY